MTYKEIRKITNQEFGKVKENYKKLLEQYLQEHNLDEMVIRIKDRKKGKLMVIASLEDAFGYELKFYPVTKTGSVSKMASGCICCFDEIADLFEPAKESEE